MGIDASRLKNVCTHCSPSPISNIMSQEVSSSPVLSPGTTAAAARNPLISARGDYEHSRKKDKEVKFPRYALNAADATAVLWYCLRAVSDPET